MFAAPPTVSVMASPEPRVVADREPAAIDIVVPAMPLPTDVSPDVVIANALPATN